MKMLQNSSVIMRSVLDLILQKKKVQQQVQAGEGKEKTNENIWNSFWTNQKSGKLIAEPRELALYDEEVDKKGGGVETGEAINAINWRLSHLQP